MIHPSFAPVLLRGMAFAVATLLAACATSTTTVVKAGQRFNLYGPSTLHVRDQTEFKLRSARINADTLVGVMAHSSDRLKVPLAKVDRLVESSRTRGAARGLAWGAVYGMALGGTYGLLNVDRSSWLVNTPTSAATLGMLGGLMYGSLAGGIVGVVVGHEQRYVFELPSTDSLSATGERNVTPDSARSPFGASVGEESALEGSPIGTAVPVVADFRGLADSLAFRQARARDSLKARQDSSRADPMRNEWYAGAELGLGLGNLPSGPRTEAGYQGLDGGLHLSGAFGMRLNPRWLIGLRYTNALAHHMYDGPEGDLFKTSRLRNFMFESTWFPRDRGFFLKGALGFGDYEYAEFEGGPTVHSSGGLAGSAGFGYAVRLLSSVNLILGADVVGARYFDGAQCVAVRPSLGVYWY